MSARESVFELEVNGETRRVTAHPLARLLDVLRNDFRLTGAKEGCGEGECGACSVLVNGRLVNSCLVPVAQVAGARIRTIEGVKASPALAALQEAFVVTNGTQCGFCTPGMIMAAVELMERNPDPDEAQIREAMAGNLCRCTGYGKIIQAVRLGCSKMSGKAGGVP